MLYEKIIQMDNAEFERTDGLSREQWLDLRKNGIGGSDAGAILGLNKYSTPLSVYLSKKSKAAFGGNKATEWGNLLEDPVRRKAREELGIEIESVPGMFRSKKHGYMTANLDGLVYVEGTKEISGQSVSGLGGYEIKTSRTGDGFSNDEIPDSYYAQVQHYMAVTGLQYFVLTVFILERYEGRHYVIPRNDRFCELLIEREADFWKNYVQKDIAPNPTGCENEADLVRALPMAEEISLDDECEEIIAEKTGIDAQIKALEKHSEALKEQILLKMSQRSTGTESERTKATCGGWVITYNTQKSKRVDISALKKAGIYDEYAKESTSRVLRISREK